ncbi:hypothetical protein [uncultured Desulfobacter sp.]|uniref:hypothetical protein n=1 Tax=uncultured Desulfobacter sp. TaxID=240139 RepID=UPI002AABEFC6|nr:hypothetical protein [uncultured Desulfobacter sp.]
MNINETNMGTSAYAMKKAIARPNLMLNLVEQISNFQSQSLNIKDLSVKQAPDLSSITDKGKLVDIIA